MSELVPAADLYRRMLDAVVPEASPSGDYGHTRFPPQVILESTVACNQQCVFCGRSYLERPRGVMAREIFYRVIDEIAHTSPLTEIFPAFMGESFTLGDELFDRLAIARRLGCKKITVNTNGTLVERYLERILEGNIDRLSISCDAHTPATHAKVRPGIKTEGLVGIYRGIEALAKAIAARGLERPLLDVSFTVFDENEAELEAFAAYWLERGLVVKTRPKVFHSGIVPGGDFRVTTGPERTPCAWVRDTFVVLWNGNVVLCPCDADARYLAGNVEAQSIAAIWNGPIAWIQELHRQHRFAELPEICRKCTDWQTRQSRTFFPDDATKTRYLDYVQAGRMFVYDPPRP